MARWPYQRVDPDRVDTDTADRPAAPPAPESPTSPPPADTRYIRWPIAPLAVGLSALQAIATVLAVHLYGVWLTATMIPICGFALLFLLAIAINPAWARLRERFGWPLPRPFSRLELVHLFAAMLVTSGVSSYGLSQQLVPLIAAPWNADWNTPQRGWSKDLLPHLNPNLYITDAETLRPFHEGISRDERGRSFEPPRESAPWSEWAAYHWKVIRLVPWGAWVRPLLGWSVMIGASYLLFYALTYLVLEQWTLGEKLIFPLSRLGEAMLPDAVAPRDRAHAVSAIPACLRGWGFWLGFAVSFGVQSFNAWNPLQLHIPLGVNSWVVNNLLANSWLKGLVGNNNQALMFFTIFTAIGLAFLLSTEITFSIWFYFILAKLILLAAVWQGYGTNLDDFPYDWLFQSNAISSQAGGAVMCFSAIVLWRCGSDHLRASAGTPPIERLRHSAPVVGVFTACAILVAWLGWNGVPTLWASVYVLITTLVCLGMMRFVAEAGIYWFQITTGFFHLHRILALGRVIAGPIIAPLVPIHSVLFLDVKCLLSGHLVTAGWLERRVNVGNADEAATRRARRRYHSTLILSIIVALAVSVVATIYVAYWRGGYQGQRWVFVSGPQHFIDSGLNAAKTPPSFESGNALAFAFGIVWCAFSVWVRRSVFLFPHPIGYIMLANQMIPYLWFSCFIGWLCKKIVIRYGAKYTFDRVRDGFIGLIFGELVAIAVWFTYSLIANEPTGVLDLNRYAV